MNAGNWKKVRGALFARLVSGEGSGRVVGREGAYLIFVMGGWYPLRKSVEKFVHRDDYNVNKFHILLWFVVKSV